MHMPPPWPQPAASDAGPAPRIRLACPPYTARTAAPAGSVTASPSAPAGTLLILELPATAVGWPVLRQQVWTLRQAAPRMPVILHIRPDNVESIQLVRRAGELRVRGVLVGDCDVAATLRPVLADPTDLGSDVEEWLRLRGMILPPGISLCIGEVFRAAARGEPPARTAERLGLAERRTRARFRRAGLPSPGQWMQAARALAAALHVQREPDQPLLSIALQHGYGDHSSLSQQVARLFRVRPGSVRGTLGWEWLLDAWLTRQPALRLAPASVSSA